MQLPTDFETFLANIRITPAQRTNLKEGHKRLRDRLAADEDLKDVVVKTFLQGSYRRATLVRPRNEKRPDVDVVVVTNLSEADNTPHQALDRLTPFLEKHYAGKWRPQGRSFGIELSQVDLDLVITSAPSEAMKKALESDAVSTDDDLEDASDWRLNTPWPAMSARMLFDQTVDVRLAKAKQEEEWKLDPLRIPDREADLWEDTHPLAQIVRTRDLNAQTGGRFVNVVKALKWWRLENHTEPKRFKGFPLERLIGECCPRDIAGMADGVTRTLERIAADYRIYVQLGMTPTLPDYGVPEHDVFARVAPEDFAVFHAQAEEAAQLARQAHDAEDPEESGNLWRKLFGNRFPEPPNNGGARKRAFEEPDAPARVKPERFA